MELVGIGIGMGAMLLTAQSDIQTFVYSWPREWVDLEGLESAGFQTPLGV